MHRAHDLTVGSARRVGRGDQLGIQKAVPIERIALIEDDFVDIPKPKALKRLLRVLSSEGLECKYSVRAERREVIEVIATILHAEEVGRQRQYLRPVLRRSMLPDHSAWLLLHPGTERTKVEHHRLSRLAAHDRK